MEKNANIPSENPAYGREGCGDYTKIGYVPSDKYKESVNLTLDAAYCDYCLGVVAEILGEKEKAEMYFARSKNYANIMKQPLKMILSSCKVFFWNSFTLFTVTLKGS